MARSTHTGTALGLSAALAMALSVLPASAFAGGRGSSGGALSRTTSAVGNATRSSGPASSPSRSSSSSSSGTTYYVDYGRPYCPTCGITPGGPPPARAPGQSGKKSSTTLDVDLGIQSVVESDGAFMGELRLKRNGLGIVASGTRYFENSGDPVNPDTVYMNVWQLAFAARGVATERSELWLSGGLSGTSSTNFDRLGGAVVGAFASHRVTPSLKAIGSVRYFAFRQAVRATEWRVGVSASFLSFGYRSFTFNSDGAVPLRGPEVGLALEF